jgi:glycosyltransferase domain-containing protein
MDVNKQCTILIPTQDRDLLLYRAIKYYEDSGFRDYNILILDSSKKAIKYNFQANFKYLYLRNIAFCAKILIGIKNIQTKYVVICNDDDFIACNGLKKGINFLNNNKDYSSYHGEYIFFRKLEKINLLTYAGAYEDTLANKLQFTNKKTEQRIVDIYSQRPHWYNALHFKKYLLKAFKIASKGNDLHFSEYALPLVVGSYGYLKVDDNFWYAKDANVYKDLSIMSIANKTKSLKEILDNNSEVKILMTQFLTKILKKKKKYCTFFLDNLFKKYFKDHLIDLKIKQSNNNFFNIIKKYLPYILKNITHLSLNYIKNKSFINSSIKKNYGPMKNHYTYKDWILIKKNLTNCSLNFQNLYKNMI